MSSKSKYMFILGISLILLFAVSIGNFDLSKVATDSGFDTSYDGGGSSSSSSWDSDSSSGGSSWDSDSSSGGDGDLFGWFENIFVGVLLILLPISGIFHEKEIKNKLILLLVAIVIVVLTVLRILLLIILIPLFALLFVSLLLLLKDSILKKGKKIKHKHTNYLPKSQANLDILERGYKIFVDVQNAWMNFDYDNLRKTTTDELYNTYYNQLQTLSVKGQKNIMSDFELVNYELVSLNKKEQLVIIKMLLEVKFYDYIVDSSDKVIRGKKRKKVHMLYDLTYVYNESAITECPNCNAPLASETAICSHCNTVIPSTRSKMKLSTKKCIRQR